jgi:hypothetical protein
MLKLYKPIQNIYLEAGCIPSNLQTDLKNYLGAWEEKFENYSTVYYEMRLHKSLSDPFIFFMRFSHIFVDALPSINEGGYFPTIFLCTPYYFRHLKS